MTGARSGTILGSVYHGEALARSSMTSRKSSLSICGADMHVSFENGTVHDTNGTQLHSNDVMLIRNATLSVAAVISIASAAAA